MVCVLNSRAQFLICCSRPYYKSIRPSLVNSDRMRAIMIMMLIHSSLGTKKLICCHWRGFIKGTKQSKWLQSHYRIVWLLFPQSDSNVPESQTRVVQLLESFLGFISHLVCAHTFKQKKLDAFISSCRFNLNLLTMLRKLKCSYLGLNSYCHYKWVLLVALSY